MIVLRLLLLVELQPVPAALPVCLHEGREGESLVLVLDGTVEVPGLGVGGGQGVKAFRPPPYLPMSAAT
jgi:hypothetical protein